MLGAVSFNINIVRAIKYIPGALSSIKLKHLAFYLPRCLFFLSGSLSLGACCKSSTDSQPVLHSSHGRSERTTIPCILARPTSGSAVVAVPQSIQKQFGSTLWAGHPFPCSILQVHGKLFSLGLQKNTDIKQQNPQMESWLRAHGFVGPGLPDYRLPSNILKALAREQRLRRQLETLRGRSSDKGLPDPFLQQNAMSNSFVEYRPHVPHRVLKPEPTKAPLPPHPKPRHSPATPLKPASKRRRYTRKMPPR